MNQDIVIGIDGGGTYTRAAVADLKGNILGFSKKGGSHPEKNHNPKINVQSAIMEAMNEAGVSLKNVKGIVGGFAGINKPEDREWAAEFIKLSELNCPAFILNDSEVAQYGAFLGKSGILAIAGTGSIVMGKTGNGLSVKNYDFHHDSEAASRFLSYHAIYEIVSNKPLYEENPFIESVLAFWSADSVDDLRLLASKGFTSNKVERIQRLSSMGKVVTAGAAGGSQIAYRASKKAADSLSVGIGLVSSLFSEEKVQLAFTGGVARNNYIQKLIMDELESGRLEKTFDCQEPQLPPVLGAVLYAYTEWGTRHDQEIIKKLLKHAQTNDYY
ncbi:hypothetical protein J7I93_18515 [Bacillus sp. ISL-47]|uniref:BadF/BadG/BcrA/BcrD ATPase family protein n=1 Tax=Bacillus sp. ISL-47 TaxID=2819130 RepID=UPI001BEA9AF6|nr:BadF/BadG/BcrA/BcrD ATPase family protein [Bacillus sp. ISL-47]MBT2690166.1 hypothetical protein [Bacillus sp. ISL-47]MBT2710385.1 hypothetical protein [Pseudomonas sp. ISL-84]